MLDRRPRAGAATGRRLRCLAALVGFAVQAASLRAEATVFRLDPARSEVKVQVGKAGLFRFAGHEHEVEAPLLSGEVTADPGDLSRSSVQLAFDAASLRVSGRGEPAADVPQVQEAMLGPKVLDTARFARVAFRSEKVGGRESTPGVYELLVEGVLSLHGVEQPLRLSVNVETKGDDLLARGTAQIRLRAFGIEPISIAGVVKVKDELKVDYVFAGKAQR